MLRKLPLRQAKRIYRMVLRWAQLGMDGLTGILQRDNQYYYNYSREKLADLPERSPITAYWPDSVK